MKTELPALTGLRGIASLWVLSFHVWLAFPRGMPTVAAVVARVGYLGVDLFFVLSGFVIALNYAGLELHRSWRGYAGFMWRRLARVWPVHFVTATLLLVGLAALAAVDLAPAKAPPLRDYWLTLTLLHAWSVPVVQRWNGISWSVSAELAAYLVFPLLALAAARVRSASWALGIAAAGFVALAVSVVALDYGRTVAVGMHRVAACFTAGVLLHRAWSLRGELHSRVWGIAAALALLTMLCGAGLFDAAIGRGRAVAFFPCLAAIVVLGLASGAGPFVRALASGPMVYLGRISYALYLGHGVVFILAASIATHRAAEQKAAIYAAAILVSLPLAHLLFAYVEEPVRRALVAWSERLGASRAAVSAGPVAIAERS